MDGTIYAGAAAAGAKDDLGTAYDNAFGQPKEFDLSPAPVTPTLIPGTYAVESGLLVNGTWTLDAQNNPDAVWVFQVPAGLTTASGSSIVLQNGAQACNVFWVTDESATLGSGSTFVGTLMALTAITVNSGATIEGRVLARTAAVTLNNNVITRPECENTTTTTTGDAATGDTATGDAATGDAATGDAATGDAATGDAATGDAATGDAPLRVTLPRAMPLRVTLPRAMPLRVTLPRVTLLRVTLPRAMPLRVTLPRVTLRPVTLPRAAMTRAATTRAGTATTARATPP